MESPAANSSAGPFSFPAPLHGEDGFEMVAPAKSRRALGQSSGTGRPVWPQTRRPGRARHLAHRGLLPLYGHELDEDTHSFGGRFGRVCRRGKRRFHGPVRPGRSKARGTAKKLVASNSRKIRPRPPPISSHLERRAGRPAHRPGYSGTQSPSLGMASAWAISPGNVPGQQPIAIEIRGKHASGHHFAQAPFTAGVEPSSARPVPSAPTVKNTL